MATTAEPAEPTLRFDRLPGRREVVEAAARRIAGSLRLTGELYDEYLDAHADRFSRLATADCTEADVDLALEQYTVPYEDQDAWIDAEVARFDRWLDGRGRRGPDPLLAAAASSASRLPRRGHVGPRQSRPRPRALARASSRGGDSGDPDDPEPARPGDRVGDTSRVDVPLREGAAA